MDKSPEIDKLAEALAKAQAKFPEIPKDKHVKMQGETKEGKAYNVNYSYSDLASVIKATRPALSENGLAVLQTIDSKGSLGLLTTLLTHVSGQWVSSCMEFSNTGKMQSIGSSITYLRRYQYQAITGVCSEDDDDGQSASHEFSNRRVSQPQRSNGAHASQTKKENHLNPTGQPNVAGVVKSSPAVATPTRGSQNSLRNTAPQGTSSQPPVIPSEQDIEAFNLLCREHGLSDEGSKQMIFDLFKRTNPRTLTLEQLRTVAKQIKSEREPLPSLNEPQPDAWYPKDGQDMSPIGAQT